MLAALAVGILTLLAAPPATAILFAFFVPSVALSRAGAARKNDGPRTAAQVFANGGIATLCVASAAVLAHGASSPSVSHALLWAYAGAYAAATADTWATEIGSAFGGIPRSIVTRRSLEPGTSGGVTLLGTLALLAGAAWIGFVWALLLQSWLAFAGVTLAGAAGAVADSFAGATLQWESGVVRGRGFRWITNDVVNVICTAVGALAAAGYALAFASRP